MRAMFALLLTLVAMSMAAEPLSTVRGQVTTDDAPLPGCTVRLQSATQSRVAVTNAQGHYDFAGVPAGEYEIEFDLEGFGNGSQRVLVRESEVTVPTEELAMTVTSETITLACGRPCSTEAPDGRFDFPLCSEYELHSVWMEAAERGDASSVSLLQSRYATADTERERHRIGGALLRKIKDDSAIWNALVRDSEIVLRFPSSGDEPSEEFLQYCAERNLDPERTWNLSYDALCTIQNDPRSQAILVRALEKDEEMLLWTAIEGLAMQHDLASLPLIEKAIARNPDKPALWSGLVYFLDERADAIAMQHLEGEDAASYWEEREYLVSARQEQQQPQ
jgi:hypothetical protein